jgi:menaquinone-dependent protoporphyrinogen IX oxidase
MLWDCAKSACACEVVIGAGETDFHFSQPLRSKVQSYSEKGMKESQSVYSISMLADY